MQNLFSEKKAAQVAAFFLFKAQGRLAVIKLTKLLYLAERLSYQKYGEPIIGDRMVSMDHGPVLSKTLNYTNGSVLESDARGWDYWISDREGHDVALKDSSLIRSADDLLELCDADIEVLEETWNSFGHFGKWELCEYTHKNCPEWEDPKGSSFGIELDKLLSALSFSEDQVRAIKGNLQSQNSINSAFRVKV